MPGPLPTVRVVSGDSYAIINESDYDPAVHVLLESPTVIADGASAPAEGNDTSGASSGSTITLVDLRKQYVDKFGKKPFGGWTAEQLAEKLAA